MLDAANSSDIKCASCPSALLSCENLSAVTGHRADCMAALLQDLDVSFCTTKPHKQLAAGLRQWTRQ